MGSIKRRRKRVRQGPAGLTPAAIRARLAEIARQMAATKRREAEVTKELRGLLASPETRRMVLQAFGRQGGTQAAANMSKEERRERATKAAKARWAKKRAP